MKKKEIRYANRFILEWHALKVVVLFFFSKVFGFARAAKDEFALSMYMPRKARLSLPKYSLLYLTYNRVRFLCTLSTIFFSRKA